MTVYIYIYTHVSAQDVTQYRTELGQLLRAVQRVCFVPHVQSLVVLEADAFPHPLTVMIPPCEAGSTVLAVVRSSRLLHLASCA